MKRAQIYLNIPASEVRMAQNAGAEWDALLRRWYVPKGMDIQRFRRWWPARTVANRQTTGKTPPGKDGTRFACREQDPT